MTILLFSVTKNYYQKFTFNSIHFIEAFSFVKESAWGYISAIVILYIDNLFVGKYFGLDAAGYYAMDFSLAGVVNIIITTPISGVLFPIINSQEPTQRSSTVKKAININYSILLPIVLFIIIFAKSFLLYGLSEKWLPALGLFRIFLIYVIFRSFCNLSATTALSIGKPNIFRKVLLIELIILCILIYPSAFFFHIEGVAIAALFSRFISAALFHYYLSQDLEITFPYYLNRAYILGLSSGISLMIVWILKERFLESLLFYQLSILFFVYVLCYSIINLFIDNVNRKEVYAMFDDIKISKPL